MYTGASLLSGATCGAALGALGSVLDSGSRVGLATAIALVALVLGVIEQARSGALRLLQCDIETPQRWMNHGDLRWALYNGLALGAGFTSRIGFTLWYFVPIASLLSGSIAVGVLVYGTYGFVRGVSAPILYAASKRFGSDPVWAQLFGRREQARRWARLILLGAAAAVLVTVGL